MHTDENSNTKASTKNDDPSSIDEDVIGLIQNMTTEKQSAQTIAAQQFKHPLPFPKSL